MPKVAPVRLQKALADAGVASRRAAEELITAGRVAVNGTVVRELGSSVRPGRDKIAVDGVPVKSTDTRTYLMLHKPPGVVSTVRDPHATRTVMDLLPPGTPRLYPAGRLDADSEGLMLLTNDGELTEQLLHPRHAVDREYAVLVRGEVNSGALHRMRDGVTVEGVRVVPVRVVVTLPPEPFEDPKIPHTRWLRIVVREGRKREVRTLCAAVHLHVIRLIRVRFGSLLLGDLEPGATRPLTNAEVKALKDPLTRNKPLDPTKPKASAARRPPKPGARTRSAAKGEPRRPTVAPGARTTTQGSPVAAKGVGRSPRPAVRRPSTTSRGAPR